MSLFGSDARHTGEQAKPHPSHQSPIQPELALSGMVLVELPQSSPNRSRSWFSARLHSPRVALTLGFHPSARAHQALAVGLWDSMLCTDDRVNRCGHIRALAEPAELVTHGVMVSGTLSET